MGLVDLTLDHWCSPCPLKQLRPARHCPTTRLPFRRQLAVQVAEVQVPRALVLVLALALAPQVALQARQHLPSQRPGQRGRLQLRSPLPRSREQQRACPWTLLAQLWRGT